MRNLHAQELRGRAGARVQLARRAVRFGGGVHPEPGVEWLAGDPEHPFSEELARVLFADEETQHIQEYANVVSIRRLGFNDHGPVHMRQVAYNAIKALVILHGAGVKTALEQDGAGCFEDSLASVLLSGFLHDLGMSVGRERHERTSAMLALPIIDRILLALLPDVEAARVLSQTLAHGAVGDIQELGNDYGIVTLRVGGDAPIVGRPLRTLDSVPGWTFLIAYVESGDGSRLPSGETVLAAGDRIGVHGGAEHGGERRAGHWQPWPGAELRCDTGRIEDLLLHRHARRTSGDLHADDPGRAVALSAEMKGATWTRTICLVAIPTDDSAGFRYTVHHDNAEEICDHRRRGRRSECCGAPASP